MKRTFIPALAAVSMALQGCVTDQGGEQKGDYALNAIIGAAAGCAVAKATDHNCGKGAAAGAVVALAATYFHNLQIEQRSEQTKTAKQMEAVAPATTPEPSLVTYSTWAEPANNMKPGQTVKYNSTIAVTSGKQAKPVQIEEEFRLYDNEKPDNVLASKRKQVNPQGGAGEFKNQFSFVVPQGVPNGNYPVKTVVFINGAEVGSRTSNLNVASADTAKTLAMQ
ncbi:MAG TPA: hypothetical protein VFM46_07090 [Pseudomonadales bacterium]|nr:hypothetical protein [Pseudomonadales bacterium]